MAKAIVLVKHKDNTIKEIKVISKGTLGLYEGDGIPFSTFDDMYAYVVALVELEGIFLDSYTHRSDTFHNIFWYDGSAWSRHVY